MNKQSIIFRLASAIFDLPFLANSSKLVHALFA